MGAIVYLQLAQRHVEAFGGRGGLVCKLPAI